MVQRPQAGSRLDGKHRGNADGEADCREEAEHPDRHNQADDDRRQADQPNRDANPFRAVGKVGIEPLPLALCRGANRSAALVGAAHDVVGAGDRPVDLRADLLRLREALIGALEDPAEFVGVHLLSIGVNGEVAPSSLAWFTPSALAI